MTETGISHAPPPSRGQSTSSQGLASRNSGRYTVWIACLGHFVRQGHHALPWQRGETGDLATQAGRRKGAPVRVTFGGQQGAC